MSGDLSLRFARLVEDLHGLGPRPVGELLLEIADGDDRVQRRIGLALERYARLEPSVVHAINADRWPASIFMVST